MGMWVPMFPLPEVVLLPRAILPLHIFEERYKAMTADALSGDRRIALAKLRRGWEKAGTANPPVEDVLCIGCIIEHVRLPDGRFNLLLQGETRAHYTGVERPGLYRVVQVEELDEKPVMDIDVIHLREQMLELFETGHLRHLPAAGQFVKLLRSFVPTSGVADLIGFHLLDATEKQLLLEEPDVRRRIERLLEQLRLLARSVRPKGPPLPPGVSLN